MIPSTPLVSFRGVLPLPDTVYPLIKREDLLPYGGGNKVRRLLRWRELHPSHTRIAAISDRGSHTLYSLAHMASLFESVALYERICSPSPYRDRLRNVYVHMPNVEVIEGSLPFLWMRARYSENNLLGIGGHIPSCASSYQTALHECIEQLSALGQSQLPTIHLFPIASGTMADGFLQYLHGKQLFHHRLVGVLTGHALSRPWLRLKYLREPFMTLQEPAIVSWDQYLRLSHSCYDQIGLRLDPNHSVYCWQALPALCRSIRAPTNLIFWITCPMQLAAHIP